MASKANNTKPITLDSEAEVESQRRALSDKRKNISLLIQLYDDFENALDEANNERYKELIRVISLVERNVETYSSSLPQDAGGLVTAATGITGYEDGQFIVDSAIIEEEAKALLMVNKEFQALVLSSLQENFGAAPDIKDIL